MIDFATLTSTDVLAIPEDQPERLFSGPDAVDAEYRAAAKRLHPDRPTGDTDGFARLTLLHSTALAKIRDGIWVTPGQLVLQGADGTPRIVRYLRAFDAGTVRGYIGRTLLTYVLPIELADLANDARNTLTKLASALYPNDKLKADIEHRRPRLKRFFQTKDGQSVLMLEKPEDMIRLRDVLDHFAGRLDPRHVAWIMSELHNLACWLEFSKLTHNDLSLDSVFICPAKHSAMILGGWWFSVPEGARMQRVQQPRTIAHLPIAVSNSKLASIRTDLGLIRLLGRELLGDESGVSLAHDPAIAPVLANWLRIATSGDARQDYRDWDEALTASFGERRFTPLTLSAAELYST